MSHKMFQGHRGTFNYRGAFGHRGSFGNRVGAVSKPAAKPAARKVPKLKPTNLVFPPELTEEELMLKSKYEMLRKKKKNLQKQLAPPQPVPEKLPPKRPKSPQILARDAREIAKKLVRSGAVKIKKDEAPEQEGFKKPMGLERKLLHINEKPVAANYQPFGMDESGSMSESTAPKSKNLIDSFVAACSGEDPGRKIEGKECYPTMGSKAKAGKNKKMDNVICISNEVSEKFVRKKFSSFGTITSIDLEKGHTFVTFDKAESAYRASVEMDGYSIGKDNRIRVCYGQSATEPLFKNDRTSSRQNDRELVVYDDIFQ